MANSKSIGYWICTALVAFFILPGGVIYVMRVPQAVQGVNQLGFPTYFVVFLGIGKILGPIALLAPGFPRLKEWAYAGIFFDLSGASVASAATGGAWWHVVAPLSIAVILFGSWALRPPSRVLGSIFLH